MDRYYLANLERVFGNSKIEYKTIITNNTVMEEN